MKIFRNVEVFFFGAVGGGGVCTSSRPEFALAIKSIPPKRRISYHKVNRHVYKALHKNLRGK